MRHISRGFFLSIDWYLPFEVSFLMVWCVLVFISVCDPWPFCKGRCHLEPGSLVAQTVKRLPTMRETQVRSPGWEDPPWKRKWQPTPVLLPGESHGWRSLVGYSPWGRKESDTTEGLHYPLMPCESSVSISLTFMVAAPESGP